jgi:hypothetical protein
MIYISLMTFPMGSCRDLSYHVLNFDVVICVVILIVLQKSASLSSHVIHLDQVE